MKTINHKLVELSLDRVSGVDFEKFVQAFFSALLGSEYVPLGGVHDGGADGWMQTSVFQSRSSDHFLQASVTNEPAAKIRQTVRRLREFGRNPKAVTYSTSKTVGKLDILERDLSDELDCRISIRDGQYITNQVNQSPQTVQAFKSYLEPTIGFLKSIGSATLIKENDNLPSRTLCVFLGQELERRRGQTQLLEAVADSLILWSLEGTDPDKDKFLRQEEIEKKVIEALPSAKTFFRSVMKNRLEALRSKSTGLGRQINFHAKPNGYCLPFETRKHIEQENVEDEVLRLDVSKIFRQRAAEQIVDRDGNQALIDTTAEICHSTIQKTFLAQGLELSLFLASDDDQDDSELPSIETHVDESLAEAGIKGEEAALIATTALDILRKTFYKSSRKERLYLGKLSRTYVLMFLLKNEPRIVEYLRSMTANFVLYVGADVIVRSLSEHMLAPNDQMTKNALRILKAAGSKLVLTDKTLDEVWHHLKNSHFEFINNFEEVAPFMTPLLAKQIDRILIRSFFYARFDAIDQGKRPLTWRKYVSQFCSVEQISKQAARDELREYLVNEFNFEFESNETLEESINPAEWDALSEKIFNVRNKGLRDEEIEKILCRNAAATVLRVFSRRAEKQERSGSNPYGYRTWWITQQSRVRAATAELVAKHNAKYMLRPEFILHFLSNMPSGSDVKDSYAEVFPSILGIRLGNRMDEGAFRSVIKNAKDVFDEMDDSRARVVLANKASQLQADFNKKYDY